MKRKFMKKALAVVLSTAMTFSLASAAELKTASAATNFVSLKTTFKTLKVGQTYRLTLKNNNINWKIQKVTTSNKPVATVYGKTSSYVMLKGKSEGRAKIKVSLKTSKRKTNNTKTLTCTAKVVAAAVDPGTVNPPTVDPGTQDPVQTTATVATQAELNAALNNSAVTSITVKTDAASTFTIPSGQYSNVDLTVDAPNGSVENNATFKSITIKAIKDSSWTEKAKGNSLRVEATKARVVVDAAASVAGITVTNANADVAIVVDGTLAGVTINAKAKVALTGKTTTKVPVTLATTAADTDVTAAVPVELKSAVNANVTLQAGAEDSTVEVTNSAAKVVLKNNTTKTIAVKRADGTSSNVGVNGSLTIQPVTNTGTGTGTGITPGYVSGGSSSSSSSTRSTVTVSTQAQLNSALANNNVGTIRIDTTSNEQLVIGSSSQVRTYSKNLIVNAPNATIDNYCNFDSVRIDAIAENTWFEHATRNILSVLAARPHIVLGSTGTLRGLNFGSSVRNAKLDINGTITGNVTCSASASANLAINVGNKNAFGSDARLKVGANMQIAISASVDSKDVKIPVDVTGKDASVISAVPVNISVSQNVDVNVTLNGGAEGSSITSAADTKITVTNKTSVKVEVSVDGENVTVDANTKVDVEVDASGDASMGEPTSTGEDEASSTGDGETPSTSDEETPSTSGEETPSTSGEETPSTSGEETPSTSGEETPSTSENESSSTGENESSSTGENESSSTGENESSSTGENESSSTDAEASSSYGATVIVKAVTGSAISAEPSSSSFVVVSVSAITVGDTSETISSWGEPTVSSGPSKATNVTPEAGTFVFGPVGSSDQKLIFSFTASAGGKNYRVSVEIDNLTNLGFTETNVESSKITVTPSN